MQECLEEFYTRLNIWKGICNTFTGRILTFTQWECHLTTNTTCSNKWILSDQTVIHPSEFRITFLSTEFVFEDGLIWFCFIQLKFFHSSWIESERPGKQFIFIFHEIQFPVFHTIRFPGRNIEFFRILHLYVYRDLGVGFIHNWIFCQYFLLFSTNFLEVESFFIKNSEVT